MSSEPLSLARLGGFFWLMTIIAGVASLVLQMRTAHDVLANETAFRAGIAASLIATGSYIAATLFVFELLAPVNRRLSRLAAFFSLTGCAFGGLTALLGFAPLVVLGRPEYVAAFEPEQLHALAQLFVRLSANANNMGLVFFGLHCALVGTLIVRSSFIPRFVGVLMIIGGCGWLTFLWPPLSNALFPFIVLPGFIGETTLTVWLLAKGVNVERWSEVYA